MFFLLFQYAIKCSMRDPDLALTLASTGIILAAQYCINQTAPEPEQENRAQPLNRENHQRIFRPAPDNSSSNQQAPYITPRLV